MSARPGGGSPTTPVRTGSVTATPTDHSSIAAPAAAAEIEGSAGNGVPYLAEQPEGELSAQRDAPVGGQAVLEGVMMGASPTGRSPCASRRPSS